jgi:hypothetical protein
MFGLTLTDYLSEGGYTSPRGSTTAGVQKTIDGPVRKRLNAAPAPAQRQQSQDDRRQFAGTMVTARSRLPIATFPLKSVASTRRV